MRFRRGIVLFSVFSVAAIGLAIACGGDEEAVKPGGDAATAPDGTATTPPPGEPPPVVPGADVPPGDNDVFGTDDRVLARLELNGNLEDSSGNSRHGKAFDPTSGAPVFVPSKFGQGLELPANAFQGIVWLQHAPMLTKPFTIEMVITPTTNTCWQRLFLWDVQTENGWYICKGVQSWPIVPLTPELPGGQRLYLAFVVHATEDGGVLDHPDGGTTDLVDVYVDGAFYGRTLAGFDSPPPGAVFFRDNKTMGEDFAGTAEAIRISIGARRADEFQAVQARLASRP